MTLIDTRKTLILPIILVGLMIGVTAAYWTATLKVTGNITTGTFNPELSLPLGGWDDNEVTKDIGHVTADIIGPPYNKIVITIDHAYPSYEAWVSIGVHHVGTVPSILKDISWDPHPPELQIWITQCPPSPWPVIGQQLHHCQEIFFYLHVHVFEDDNAIPPIKPLPDTTYTFTVTITLVQYNKP
jgi:predicted ribosomally synthesized peptide with SipW-like signal peptide